ncbi:hypothetical protein VPH35_014103 [Triticum aestivum]
MVFVVEEGPTKAAAVMVEAAAVATKGGRGDRGGNGDQEKCGHPGPQGPQGQKVFLRADLNILLDDGRNITEDNRIRASVPSVPSLKFLMGKGAKVILANHLLATPHLPARSPLAVGPARPPLLWCTVPDPALYVRLPRAARQSPPSFSLSCGAWLYLLDVGSNTTGWSCRAFIADLTDLGS